MDVRLKVSKAAERQRQSALGVMPITSCRILLRLLLDSYLSAEEVVFAPAVHEREEYHAECKRWTQELPQNRVDLCRSPRSGSFCPESGFCQRREGSVGAGHGKPLPECFDLDP